MTVPIPVAASHRALEPIDRISEVLFGLIMVLTFTGSLSVADAGRDDVRTMLVGALGCNLAWGVIDAILFLMGRLAERGRAASTLRAVRDAATDDEARRLIAEALPPTLLGVLVPAEIDTIRARLSRVPQPAAARAFTAEDWRGAAAVFLLVFLSTFPVALPFLFVSDAGHALRVSNAIAVGLLFLTGYAFGRVSGHRPLSVGVVMVVLGLVLVGLTIALGG